MCILGSGWLLFSWTFSFLVYMLSRILDGKCWRCSSLVLSSPEVLGSSLSTAEGIQVKNWRKWSLSLGGFRVKPAVVTCEGNGFLVGTFTSGWLFSHIHARAHFSVTSSELFIQSPVKIPSPWFYNWLSFIHGQLGRCVLKSFVHICCYLFCKLKIEMYFKVYSVFSLLFLRLIK